MRAVLKCILLFFFLQIGSAAALDKKPDGSGSTPQRLPAELSKWVPWLETTQPQRNCPKQNDQAHCLFPSRLNIDIVSVRELRFELRVVSTAHAAEKMALPGAVEAWPQALLLNGKAVAVTTENRKPVLWIPGAGEWLISGVITAVKALPQTLEIPPDVATVRLIERGVERTVQRPEPGVLALSQAESAKSGGERALEASVFRKISDGQVSRITTLLRLKVSGVERGLEVEGFLPAGAEWISVESDLPWEIKAGGKLWLKLRPGVHEVRATTRVAAPLSGLDVPTWSAPELQIQQEVWMFEPAANLRQVAVEGLGSIDPSRLDIPEDFAGLQAYAATP